MEHGEDYWRTLETSDWGRHPTLPDKMGAGLVGQVWKVTFAIFSVINFWYQHWKSTLKGRVEGGGA